MRLIEKIAFYLLLATLPLQLGKHFWPEFSFVDGIRVDYLSPTIYLSDLFFIVLFLASALSIKKKVYSILKHPLFLFILGILLISSLLSQYPLAAFYGVIKTLQFVYFGCYIALIFRAQKNNIIFLLALGGLVQVIIAVFQMVAQRSIGGYFYFLGERTFSVSTPGIALFNFGGEQLLRPYGTFPHPNVLAFYLLTAFLLLLFSFRPRYDLIAFFKFVALFALSLGIILTLSRVVILLYFFAIAVWCASPNGLRKSIRVRIASVGIFAALSMLAVVFGRLDSIQRDWLYRADLLMIGWEVFLKNPIIGVGLNNFFYHEIDYQKVVSPILLQPVHNIFVMWFVQTGLLGGGGVLLFLSKILRRTSPLRVVLLVSVAVVGMFDHYLITLQQGQFMLAVTLGIVYSAKDSELGLPQRVDTRCNTYHPWDQ